MSDDNVRMGEVHFSATVVLFAAVVAAFWLEAKARWGQSQ